MLRRLAGARCAFPKWGAFKTGMGVPLGGSLDLQESTRVKVKRGLQRVEKTGAVFRREFLLYWERDRGEVRKGGPAGGAFGKHAAC